MRFFALLCWALLLAAPVRAAGYGDWAAVIVAGDNHAESGAQSEVFDNARRDLGKAFASIGFLPNNIQQYSVQPEKYPREGVRQSDVVGINDGLWDLTGRASGGCLVYFTSHGNTDGIAVNGAILSPDILSKMVDNACGRKPTVVIISACFSGVFVPYLRAPNRFVLTAARPDRPSFGCGEEDRYTFFDTCMLSSLPASTDFPDLSNKVIACVGAREKQIGALPSEPQVSVGDQVMANLPRWR